MLKNSFDSDDASNRLNDIKTSERPEIDVQNPINDILPFGALGRLLSRRNELRDKTFTPDTEDVNVRSYLSSQIGTEWKAQKSSDVLKKLIG
jgi:hypothetical protein